MQIIYEDDSILVVSKPAGQVVNKAETVRGGVTLQGELEGYLSKRLTAYGKRQRETSPRRNPAARLPARQGKTLRVKGARTRRVEECGVKELARGGGEDFTRRAGIVHRLDKDTSGVLVVAKTPEAFADLQAQFKRREVRKEYLALVHGSTSLTTGGKVKAKEGVIEAPIARNPKNPMRFAVVKGGRKATTAYDLLQHYNKTLYCSAGEGEFSYLKVKPLTGRTHQIRVHMKHIGHPVVSDPFYLSKRMLEADRKWCPRLFLHAESLGFKHPATGAWVRFETELPEDLRGALGSLSR